MVEPVSFPSSTSQFELPLLFAGQAQKEFFINQSFALIDALLQNGVTASSDLPPVDPPEGSAFRIVSPAQNEWAAREDQIAIQIGGAWHFALPVDGMTLFDRDAGVLLHFQGGWQSAVEPAAAAGGATIDVEARQMLAELVEALRKIGVFSTSP